MQGNSKYLKPSGILGHKAQNSSHAVHKEWPDHKELQSQLLNKHQGTRLTLVFIRGLLGFHPDRT
jgi:hypothetical protein